MATVQPQLFAPQVVKPDYSVPVLPEVMDNRVMTQKSINLESRDVYFYAMTPNIDLSSDNISSIYVNSDGNSFWDMDNSNLEFEFTPTSVGNVPAYLYQYGEMISQTISYINDAQVEIRLKTDDISTLQVKASPKQHMSNSYYGVNGDDYTKMSEFASNGKVKVSLPIRFLTGVAGGKMMNMFHPIKNFRLDIKWNSPQSAFTCADALTVALKNIRIVAKYIKVDSVIRDAMIAEVNRNGRMQFLSSNYGVNILQLGVSASQQALLLNHPYTRPRALFFVAKDASKVNQSDVKRAFISVAGSCYWLIGGSTTPNVGIDAQQGDELLFQLDRCFGKSAGLQTAYWALNKKSLITASPTASSGSNFYNDASAVIAYDAEVVHNLSSTGLGALSGNGANAQFVLNRTITNSTKALECLSIVNYEYLIDIFADTSVKTSQ